MYFAFGLRNIPSMMQKQFFDNLSHDSSIRLQMQLKWTAMVVAAQSRFLSAVEFQAR
jgi:hypothetical protein